MATQIRSHAHKHFLEVHKLGLTAAAAPPAPRRVPSKVPVPQQSLMAPALSQTPGTRQSLDWPNNGGSFVAATLIGSSEEVPIDGRSPIGEEAWFADGLWRGNTVVQLPLSQDDLRFSEVNRFIADVFSSGTLWPVEAQLQRLHGVDPVVAETILLVLRNLQDNLRP
ncbi:hypothetical protein PR202_gb24771 [Eleusine coracana subsp. coracana]|uniref:Uncharacterized protein n=1 Tax=Eleusine coracana subsp. coracana TaxID=191504 RepID=A0AAV5FJJ6_ELECO|nr:hypothetical protein QOZ80_5BG0452130 [Eleusine coracana subsp. coracana]GJN35953.1 hypothetical protein PR202_gb24771 [Eleusine coracana subsp. coracana]